jgi:hypothetical protein
MNCNQCYYNRPGAYYIDTDKPLIPGVEGVGDGIVRVNSGHDSNIDKGRVIKVAKRYKHFFFNTSMPNFDFPGPVVYTANKCEEKLACIPRDCVSNLMFVRLKVSSTNLNYVEAAIALHQYFNKYVPIVLTFMRYYDYKPSEPAGGEKWYEYKKHIKNDSWCPTTHFKTAVMNRMKKIGGRLVTMCGTIDSNYCRDCKNCETYYWQTIKHMREIDANT